MYTNKKKRTSCHIEKLLLDKSCAQPKKKKKKKKTWEDDHKWFRNDSVRFFFEQEQNQNYNLLYDYHGLHMESVSLPSVDEGGRGES